MEKIKVNLDAGPFFRGIGDLAILLFVSDYFKFYTIKPPKIDLLRAYGIESETDKEGAINLSKAYDLELKDCGKRYRLEYIKEVLGIDFEYKRPELKTSPSEWVQRHIQRAGKRKIITLCPQTCWGVRSWTKNNWVYLAWQLKLRRYHPVIFLNDGDNDYAECSCVLFERPFSDLIHFLNLSDLIVGVDSCPAHLGALLGKPTIALQAPTTPICTFGNWDNVQSIQGRLSCTGCHYNSALGFNPSCCVGGSKITNGCRSMLSIAADDVFKEIVNKINQLP